MADYSFIANTPKYETANPLAMMGQYAQVGNALLGIQARQAIGQDYQTAYDPVAGRTDYSKLLGTIEQDPRAAWMAPQIAQQIQTQQLLGYKLNEAQLAQTQQRMNAIRSSMGAFLAKPDDQVSPSDVTSVLAGMKAGGYPVDEFINMAATTMPTGGKPLKDWITQQVASAMPATAQAEMFKPQVALPDVGPGIQPTNVNAYAGPVGPMAPMLGKDLTPEGKIGLHPGPVGPRGEQTMVTGAQLQAMGLGGLTTGRFQVPAALHNPANANPSQLPGANPDVGTDAASAPVSSAAPMVTGLGPQEKAGLEASGQVGAQQWGAAMQAAGGSAARQFILQQALHSLQNAPTGPGTDKVNYYKSTFQALAPTLASAFGVDPNNVADYDKANKYLTQYAMQQAASRGGTTDSQLATTLTGNASTHISNLAAQQVVQANMALEKMSQAEMQSFQAGLDLATGKVSGAQPTADQFPNFRARWNQTMDPRAFLADTLTKDQFLAAAKAGGPKFRNTFNMAIRNNWISPPAWAQ